MSQTSKIVIVLVIGAIFLIGGATVIMSSTASLNQTDLGVIGNATLDGAASMTVPVFGAMQWFFLALGAFGLVSILFLLLRRA